MNRLIQQLEKYDDNLTLSRLKELILEEDEKANSKETEKIKYIKDNFENTYLKELDTEYFLGTTLNVYKLTNFVKSEKTTEWELIYSFEGNIISFNKHSLGYRAINTNRCGDEFSEKQLREMVKITKEEFDEYKIEYDTLNGKLEELLNQ